MSSTLELYRKENIICKTKKMLIKFLLLKNSCKTIVTISKTPKN